MFFFHGKINPKEEPKHSESLLYVVTAQGICLETLVTKLEVLLESGLLNMCGVGWVRGGGFQMES